MKKGISSAAYLRSVRIIYLAQVSSLVILALMVLFLNQGKESDKAMADTLQYPLIVAFVIGLATSQLIPRYLIRKIDTTQPLKYKMARYVMAIIIRAACIELPGLFACIVSLLSGQLYYLLVIPLLLILFMLYRPSRASIVQELHLNNNEREQLYDPEAIIAEAHERKS